MTTAQGLAWRLRRHGLDPVAGTTVTDVVRRVVALRAWPAHLADLAISVRQAQPRPGALARALQDGEVICSYAFRGGSYVFTPEVAAVLLSVRTATRVWQTRRYQAQGGFALQDWEPLREAIRELLATGPKTRAEIAAMLAREPASSQLAPAASGTGSDSLYKPLHWWGDICFGPPRDGQATFRLLPADARWPGPPDVDEAGRRAVGLYLGSYGPATAANLHYWLTEGLSVPRRRVQGWLADLGETVTEVTLDGTPAYALTADLDALSTSEPSEVVRFLPGFDPWVMGPGTADERLIAPQRRALASRGAHLVIWRGRVAGTWRLEGHALRVSWFEEDGPAPVAALEDAGRRLPDPHAPELKLELSGLG